MGTIDENGIYFYEENDLFAPIHTTLNALSGSVSDAVGELNEATQEYNGFVVCPVSDTTNFAVYGGSSANTPRVTRSGQTVAVSGVVTTKVNGYVSGSTTRVFASVPYGFRPSAVFGVTARAIMQGTGDNRWHFTVGTSGSLGASRYGPSGDTTGAWMPFYMTWITSDPWPTV